MTALYRVARPQTPPRHTFPQLLTAHRERLWISQSEVARRIGVNHTHVSRLESGDRQPSRETAHRLADALGLTPGERFALGAAAGYCLIAPGQTWVIEAVAGMLDSERERESA